MVLKTMLDLFLIATIVVCVTDIAQFFTYFEDWLGKKIGGTVSFKILECSGCQVTWTGFAWLLFTHSFTLQTMAINLVIAWVFVPLIGDTLMLIRELIGKLIRLAYKLAD